MQNLDDKYVSFLCDIVLGSSADKYMVEALNLVTKLSEQLSELGVDQTDKTGFRTFAGRRVFEVDSETFNKCRLGKKKYARYEQYVGTGEVGEAIRAYGKTHHSKRGIILVDKTTGAMLYLRYPKSFKLSF